MSEMKQCVLRKEDVRRIDSRMPSKVSGTFFLIFWFVFLVAFVFFAFANPTVRFRVLGEFICGGITAACAAAWLMINVWGYKAIIHRCGSQVKMLDVTGNEFLRTQVLPRGYSGSCHHCPQISRVYFELPLGGIWRGYGQFNSSRGYLGWRFVVWFTSGDELFLLGQGVEVGEERKRSARIHTDVAQLFNRLATGHLMSESLGPMSYVLKLEEQVEKKLPVQIAAALKERDEARHANSSIVLERDESVQKARCLSLKTFELFTQAHKRIKMLRGQRGNRPTKADQVEREWLMQQCVNFEESNEIVDKYRTELEHLKNERALQSGEQTTAEAATSAPAGGAGVRSET